MYVTEALKILTENTAKTVRGGGSMIAERYYDIINGKTQEHRETKTGDEIVRDIVERGGLELA